MDFVNNYLTELEEFRGDENQLVRHMSNFPIHFRQLFQFAQWYKLQGVFGIFIFKISHKRFSQPFRIGPKNT